MLSVAERALAVEHQQAVSALTEIVQREVSMAVWGLDGNSPAVVREALKELIPGIAERYGDAAAAVAMDYYEFAREAAAVPGMFIPDPAGLPPMARFEESIRWSVGAITGEHASFATLASKLGGSVSRAVAGVASDTLVGATKSDKRAQGWSRVLEPGACSFCQMLSDNGAIYDSESVVFRSHEDCRCGVAPHFSWGQGDTRASGAPYRESKRRAKRTDADRKRTRDYLATHYPTG